VLKERGERMVEIYRAILKSPEKLASFQSYPIRFANAMSILQRTLDVVQKLNLENIGESVNDITRRLAEWERSSLKISSGPYRAS